MDERMGMVKMRRLSYETLKELNYEGYLLKEGPERVLQFGEGVFLRAFADDLIDRMNEKTDFCSKVVVVQPRGTGSGRVKDAINEQEGLYTLLLRGNEKGKRVDERRVISCISRCLNPISDYEEYMACARNPELRFIISNTTEAGIKFDPSCSLEDKPAAGFPAKLTQFLYERYKTFGREKGGLVILPCELIEDNGKELERTVLAYAAYWNLEAAFMGWIGTENIFCSTLVDRIVTGYPEEEAEKVCRELGYEDQALDTGEVFGSWVIEAPDRLKEELPFEAAGLPVLLTDDHRPYKQRKVRILNGAHTSMVLGAYLAGKNIVRDCMKDQVIRGFMEQTVYEEIIPTLSLPGQELKDFAGAVADRFDNPFIDHELLAISLNSTSKWRARVLPSLKGYVEKLGSIPKCIAASLAFYIAFYEGSRIEEGILVGKRGEEEYPVRDEQRVLEFFLSHKEDEKEALAGAVLSNREFWGEDLTEIPGLLREVTEDLDLMEKEGAYEVMRKCLEKIHPKQ